MHCQEEYITVPQNNQSVHFVFAELERAATFKLQQSAANSHILSTTDTVLAINISSLADPWLIRTTVSGLKYPR